MPPEIKFTVQKDNHWACSALLSVDYVYRVIGGEALQMGCTLPRKHTHSGMIQDRLYIWYLLVHKNRICH